MARYLSNRLKSFGYALRGLVYVVRSQPNARIHMIATFVVLIASVFLHLALGEWLWIAAAIALVWIMEAMNTAFEHLCDVVSPAHSESVKRAKDIAAGSVLIAAVFALVVAGVILVPKVYLLI